MSQAPFMPLATDAYLADTTHLTTEEHGAYLLILLATWRNNGKPLPDDDIRISRVIRCTVKRWKTKIRPVVIQFFDISDGTLRQKRLEKAWIDVAKNIQQKSQAGQASALKRNKTTSTAVQRPANGKATNHNHNHNHNSKKNIDRAKPTKLSLDWRPTDDHRKYAAEYGFTGRGYSDLCEGFAEYWQNGNGRGKSKIDWFRTFQTWVRNQTPRNIPKGGGPVDGYKGTSSFARAASELLSEVESELKGYEDSRVYGEGEHGGSGEVIEGEFNPGPEGCSGEGTHETGDKNGDEERGTGGFETQDRGVSGRIGTTSGRHGNPRPQDLAPPPTGKVVPILG